MKMKTIYVKNGKATVSKVKQIIFDEKNNDSYEPRGYEDIDKAKNQLENACKKYGRLIRELETFTDFLEINGATKYKPLQEFHKVNDKALQDIRQALVKLSQSTRSMR